MHLLEGNQCTRPIKGSVTDLKAKSAVVLVMSLVRGVYGGGIVWNNSVSMNSEGRVQHTGWNMEAGYVTGEDADSFTEVDGQRSLRNLSESATYRTIRLDIQASEFIMVSHTRSSRERFAL